MSTDNDHGRTRRPGPLGVPLSAWVAGLAVGAVLGIILFDGAASFIFAIGIGTAFALAFRGVR